MTLLEPALQREPDADVAADWIVSCTSAITAWFVASVRPEISAWSMVGRGMSVRWNVVGRVPAARSSPVWSARCPSERAM